METLEPRYSRSLAGQAELPTLVAAVAAAVVVPPVVAVVVVLAFALVSGVPLGLALAVASEPVLPSFHYAPRGPRVPVVLNPSAPHLLDPMMGRSSPVAWLRNHPNWVTLFLEQGQQQW